MKRLGSRKRFRVGSTMQEEIEKAKFNEERERKHSKGRA